MEQNPRENRIDSIEFPAASVKALESARKFYGEVFGWNFQQWGDTYADTRESGVGAGINSDASLRPAAPLVVLCSSQLEQTRDRVLRAGGMITKEIFPFPGGRRFHYRDPAGNELAVWSDC